VLHARHSDQPRLCGRAQQPRLRAQGQRQHTRGNTELSHRAQAQAGLPGRLLQPGPLPTDRVRLDGLQRPHEEDREHCGGSAGEESTAQRPSPSFHALSALT